MKQSLNGRIVITVKDVAILTGWGLNKCREFIKECKQKLGLLKNDVFTVYHLSQALKVPVEEIQIRLT